MQHTTGNNDPQIGDTPIIEMDKKSSAFEEPLCFFVKFVFM